MLEFFVGTPPPPVPPPLVLSFYVLSIGPFSILPYPVAGKGGVMIKVIGQTQSMLIIDITEETYMKIRRLTA